METAINYWWVVPVLILLLILVGWMIRRNAKDEGEYEKHLTKSQRKIRKHNERGNDAS